MKKYTVINDFRLFVMLLSPLVLILGGSIYLIVLIGKPGAAATEGDAIFCQILFGVMTFIYFVATLVCASHSVYWITLSADEITLSFLFRKKETTSYEAYPYLYHGSYYHGNIVGMGYLVHYLVFSKVQIPQVKLEQANTIPSTVETFKILLSTKNIAMLQKVLPPRQQMRLRECLPPTKPSK